MAACRAGDTLVVTKLDRLARSLPDARAIADELTARSVRLSLGGSVYDPTDAVGRLLFKVLAMVAEFEADLIRLRTREGMKVAKAKGHLRGKQPKLSRHQEAHLVSLVRSGEYSTARLPSCSASPVPRSTGPSSASRTGHAPKPGCSSGWAEAATDQALPAEGLSVPQRVGPADDRSLCTSPRRPFRGHDWKRGQLPAAYDPHRGTSRTRRRGPSRTAPGSG